MKATYFYIKYVIERGDLMLQYYPTEIMWVDILNKPKQGTLFRRDQFHLMNMSIDYDNNVERGLTNPQLLAHENTSRDK